MPHVPGLRSPYVSVSRLVYFGRMLDKIRLQARSLLPPDYQSNLGKGFDARTCRFLGIRYEELRDRVQAGGGDEEIMEWVESRGGRRSDTDCDVWNQFMMKRGWRDDASPDLEQRLINQGFGGRPIATFFDLIDYDEGRDPVRRRAWELRPAQVALVMGVAGSGKSTIGRALADVLGWRFADADEFHPAANVAKMSTGQPLADTDRQPWLAALRQFIAGQLHVGESAVVACSALKARYREVLMVDPDSVLLIYLKGSREVLQQRLGERTGHFMPVALLDSQLADLEEPNPEHALVCDIAEPPEKLVAQLRSALEG
jgi:carbohydrate kinase (thermoresistant glucokinase family)